VVQRQVTGEVRQHPRLTSNTSATSTLLKKLSLDHPFASICYSCSDPYLLKKTNDAYLSISSGSHGETAPFFWMAAHASALWCPPEKGDTNRVARSSSSLAIICATI
jgi:hypothetical protein